MVRISEAITKDHQDLESLYKAILTSEDADEQKRFQDQFTWELARHAVAEELVVHPAIEKVLPDGKETTDRDRREHSTVKQLLDVLQDLECSDKEYLPTLTALMDGFTEHMNQETIELLELESNIATKDSEKLTKLLRQTKIFVPSSLYQEPPCESPAGLLTAPLDHLQTIFSKWPQTEDSQNQPGG
ncbi:uncharacterized protein N7506_003935 [Penicillium brevicompactum]|uniref:uncharacterized protein n=1 Tax=Penicillium brevicompactum TaxID=5074 RepID=UPI002541D175|nr:uncharacterized protein N7506_003935 [Penicillium brevicompactum]KAJ5335913.1 hypothetical protein N7506_003935 [Penicillium brevicompactum]